MNIIEAIKRTRAEVDEETGNHKDGIISKKKRTRRRKQGAKVGDASDGAQPNSTSTHVSPNPHSPSPPVPMQDTMNGPVGEEGDILGALEKETIRMIKDALKGPGHAAITKELAAVKGELKIRDAQVRDLKADLCLGQERERGLQQRYGRALNQLDRMDVILDLTRNHMNFLDGEYKTARCELLAARSLVGTTRVEMYDLLRAKQKAEQSCRVHEDHTKTANKTIDSLQSELAVEKARVVELETKYGV